VYQDQDLAEGVCVALDSQAAVHIARVLRLNPGDPVVLFNGRGGEYHGEIEFAEKRRVSVKLKERVERSLESPLRIVLGQGISKGERMDVAVQKAVELGVAELAPLTTRRSVVNLNAERRAKRRAHWQGVAQSACEQCGRNTVPEIQPVQSLVAWLESLQTEGAVQSGAKLVLHHRVSRSLNDVSLDPHEPVRVLIGPEGGLSDEEIVLAENCGFVPVRLGPRVLRTETAALVVISALQTLWGDLGGTETSNIKGK
jgi:16S rRNA (uracil1498-N3)-methyltransferase